jgi:hypothetical protein
VPNNKKESIQVVAIHEAGHAVAAYATWGRLQDQGIVLDGPLRGKTSIRFPVIRYRNHAGRWKYHPEIMRLAHWGNIVTGLAGPDRRE